MSCTKTEGMGEQLTAVTKTVLDVAQKMRVQRAITLQQLRVDATHALVQEASKTTASFISRQKELKESGMAPDTIKKTLGHPSNHITNRWLEMWLQTLSQEEQEKEKAIIAQWEGGWVALQKEIPHLKICRMYGGATKRIEVAIPFEEEMRRQPEQWSTSVTRSFCLMLKALAADATPLMGTAPPSDLERQLQRMLDSSKPAA